MKKILFAFAAGLIPTLAVTNHTYGQQSVAAVMAKHEIGNSLNESGGNDTKPGILAFNAVNPKALRSFKKKYKANNERWMRGVDCIVASYTSNGVTQEVLYTKNGIWIGSVKSYTEDKMPKDVRTIVKQVYFDDTILQVNEISMNVGLNGSPMYLITLGTKNHIKQITVHDLEMNDYQEFGKSSDLATPQTLSIKAE